MGKLTFTNIDFKPLDSKHHQITGNWKLIRNDSLGDLSGYYTLLWKKIEDQWVIVYDHTN